MQYTREVCWLEFLSNHNLCHTLFRSDRGYSRILSAMAGMFALRAPVVLAALGVLLVEAVDLRRFGDGGALAVLQDADRKNILKYSSRDPEVGSNISSDQSTFSEPVTFVTAFLDVGRGAAQKRPQKQRDWFESDADFLEYHRDTHNWATRAASQVVHNPMETSTGAPRDYIAQFKSLIRVLRPCRRTHTKNEIVAYVDVRWFFRVLVMVLENARRCAETSAATVVRKLIAVDIEETSKETAQAFLAGLHLETLSQDTQALARWYADEVIRTSDSTPVSSVALMPQSSISTFYPGIAQCATASELILTDQITFVTHIPAYCKCGRYTPEVGGKSTLGSCDPEMWSPLYNCLMHAKFAYLNYTVSQNAREDERFVSWIDFGYVRDRNTTWVPHRQENDALAPPTDWSLSSAKLREFATTQAAQSQNLGSARAKNTLFLLTLADAKDVPAFLEARSRDIYKKTWVTVTGGAFLSTAGFMKDYVVPLYFSALEYWHYCLKLADDEQSLLSLIWTWGNRITENASLLAANSRLLQQCSDNEEMITPKTREQLLAQVRSGFNEADHHARLKAQLKAMFYPSASETDCAAFRSPRGTLAAMPNLRSGWLGWCLFFQMMGTELAPVSGYANDNQSFKNIDNLVIVAHPDDESIWGAELLDEKTHVVLVTLADSAGQGVHLRRRAFQHAMAAAGVKSFEQWDFDESENYRNTNLTPWSEPEQHRLWRS